MSATYDAGPSHAARVIDDLCNRFESGWRAGNPVLLEDLIGEAPDDARPGFLRAALAIERELRQAGGTPFTPVEARTRFTGLGPWAVAILDDVFPDEPSLTLGVIHGPYAGRSFPLGGHATFTVGRQSGSTSA
jgi:hypothetical protein